MKNLPVTNSAQLWIGHEAALMQQVQSYVHQIFCLEQKCTGCSISLQIQQQQYHACLWFIPEGNGYTLDTIKPFFTTIARSLHNHEKFFFIFQHADYLSTACSNSLLKSIEEPPPGYHMIFLAQNLNNVSPTLKSRCIISSIASPSSVSKPHELVPFFIGQNYDFEQFLQTLDTAPPDDRTTQETIEQILHYWCQEYKKHLATDHEQKIDTIIHVVRSSLAKPPMPGSAKIFWKNLFLTMQLL